MIGFMPLGELIGALVVPWPKEVELLVREMAKWVKKKTQMGTTGLGLFSAYQ